ncbi:protein NO VEIN domain-containing protein [Lascolabacillus massiliensis]|uniref:protein NO VEIN domain-containing protein n=1 Tax=Lascolabacillus massiliensis TaxID=1627894 RepID=UPI0006B3B9A1|nr:DUF3883 domain-containing protein [Lascolabacillus massiliensis]
MKKKIKYYSITYGHVVASWYILSLISRHEHLKPDAVHRILNNSGKLGGTMPSKQGLKICIDYELLVFKDGILHLTDISKNEIVSLCDNDDPNIDALRAILFHLISYHNFQWLIFYDSDPEIFRAYLFDNDQEWTNLLDNAKLFNFDEPCVNDWWNRVLAKYEDYKEKLKKAIGDVGEKLTYEHELSRIDRDGFKPAKSFVKWASLISDRFGYDILSIKGKSLPFDLNDRDKIQIEVKSSDISNIESFRFYISKPEWKTALNNLQSYFFYCWPGINLEKESAIDGPFIIPAKELEDHMPKDTSPISEWSECRCVLDISKYRI